MERHFAIWNGAPDRAILVGTSCAYGDRTQVSGDSWDAQDSLDELASLTDTLGGRVVARVFQERERPDPATFIGKGKAREIADLVRAEKATTVVFDCDLSPSQKRNLSRATGVPVMDRTLLILEIFARRARSREAKTQVELARMEYHLSHLAGQWKHLERQRGSLSARGGPGEKQIETDRRIIESRIRRLKAELQKISQDRTVRRAPRKDFFQMAMTGYTNAGKSTLFNALTRADVFVEDRLFATLDPTVRALRGPFGETVLLSDTVGFIRHLPPRLVASFRSTLEEICSADMILEVVDVSHPAFERHMATTHGILAEMKLHDTPRVRIFNKTDRADASRLERARRADAAGLFVSAIDPNSVLRLREALLRRMAAAYVEDVVDLDVTDAKARASVYELTHVASEKTVDGRMAIRFRTSPRRFARLREILATRVED